MAFSRDLGERYSPLYAFNAIAAGGLAISFFMYLFWMARVTLSALPTAGPLYSLALETGPLESIITLAALAGFIFFTAQHALLLRWNLLSFKQWTRTKTYIAFEKSNDKTVLMTLPLTFAVSILVSLMVLCMALPFLFSILEFVLVVAFACYAYLGWHAIKIYYESFLSITHESSAPEETRGNNLGQLISIMCFLMISLGFATISATSGIKITFFVAFVGAALFLTLALLVAFLWFCPKMRALFEKRLPPESSPLLWFAGTLLGLHFLSWHYLRLTLSTAFGGAYDASQTICFLTFAFVLCLILGMMGRASLKSNGLLDQMLSGKIYSAGLYAVVCPALLLLILAHYFIGALVQTGLLEPWSLYYFIFYLPVLVLQAGIIRLYLNLNAKLFSRNRAQKPPVSQ